MSASRVSPTDRIREIAVAIAEADAAYATGDHLLVDADYDELRAELGVLITAHPELTPDPNPLERIWMPAEIGDPVRHRQPMHGMEKIAPPDRAAGVATFTARFPGVPHLASEKLDGCAASVVFVGGKLQHVATRGTGTTGENITAIARAAVRLIPREVKAVGEVVDVRGEIVMLRSTLATWNTSTTGRPLSNPRAAAAGVLGLKDPRAAAGRELHFFAFDVLVDGVTRAGPTLEDELRSLGFTPAQMTVCASDAEILAAITAIETRRLEGNVDIDGVVVRVADAAVYMRAGARSNSARGAVAVKFEPEKRTTTLLNVLWTVGGGGKVVPNAVLEPVYVGGVLVSAATLANQEIIARRGLLIGGQQVIVCRRGDVIPFVEGPAPGGQPAGLQPIVAPERCPSCADELIERGVGRELYCTNLQCSAQGARRLMHWASRAAADIDALGDVWIQRLFDAGVISRPEDLYGLIGRDLLQFPGMGETSAARMIVSIDRSRSIGLRRALIGLGIRHASEGTAKRLCRAGYESIEQVAAATSLELQRVDDVGAVVAQSLVEFFRRDETQETVRALRAAGLNLDVLDEDRPPTPGATATASGANAPLAGQVLVITGAITSPYTQEKITREAFARLLELAGATVSGSVSKSTTALICGANVGAGKTSKAEAAGVNVVAQSEIWPRLREAQLV